MTRLSKTCWLAVVAVASLVIGGAARAQTPSPYQVDSSTLHLYHFDEEKGAYQDAVSKDAAFALGRKNGASVMRSFEGFGNALDTRSQGGSRAITAKHISSQTMWDPATRAFTYEALVRMDFEPQAMSETRLTRMMIFSVDSNRSSSTRGFEFGLRPPGVLGSTTASLEFLRFAGEGEDSRIYPIVAPLPRSGPHAAQRGKWFHVALTYNGEPNVPGNVKFYWTSLAAGATEANLIYQGLLTHEMPNQKSILNFAVGNSARKAAGFQENWAGQIDEVRISNVAREPGDFLFTQKGVSAEVTGLGRRSEQ